MSIGLSDTEKWPRVTSTQLSKPPIDRLDPKSALHEKVKSYLLDRLQASERKMTGFHARWRANEIRHQAYVNLPDYEKALKQMTTQRAPPEITSIVVPYSFATINTIVTYLVNAFAGRKPMFQLGANKSESVNAAQYQEIVLQHNADHTRLIKWLYQSLLDGQIYGVSVLRTLWREEKAMRTVVKQQPSMFGQGGIPVKTREEKVVYEGNEVICVDPFMFFPDPRVPMSEVNRRGEFVFFRSMEGKHQLLTQQHAGLIKYVEAAGELPRDSYGNSVRNLTAGQNETVLSPSERSLTSNVTIQVDQGTVNLIPAELGLGVETWPVKWIFTLLNKNQIVQAEPLDYDHGMHPVCVSEPYTQGYGFGQSGMADMLAPMQDAMSWLINSHIYNVRASLHNMFLFDPSRIEVQDLQNPKPGKLIRVKQAAMGQDIRTMFQQLQVQDVTANHIRDFELFMRMGDVLSSVNDNLRGIQDSGGRKTATEVRTSVEAGASRLASMARLISSQQIVDLAEQMSINIMQFMSQEFYSQVAGIKGAMEAVSISPEMVVGDFHYPVHDGTLPLDKVALLDVWKEIFLAVSANPNLSAVFNIVELFTYMAELGGARNIDKFKLQQMPDPMLQAQVQAGNMVPLGGPGGVQQGALPGATVRPNGAGAGLNGAGAAGPAVQLPGGGE